METTGTSGPPEWVQQEGESLYNQAQQIGDRPYPDYTQDRTAAFAPDTRAAFDLTRSNVGNWQDPYQSGKAPVSQENLNQYMNPYLSMVVDPMVERMNREYQRQRIQSNANLVNRGSYMNEDRRGVIDAVQRSLFNESMAGQIGQLYAGGFNTALGAAQSQKARELQAAPLGQQMGAVDVSQLRNVGMAQEGMDQRELDLAYEEFLKSFYYPQDTANWQLGFLSGVPTQTETMTPNLIPQSNPLTATIGAIAGGAGTVAKIGGAGGFGLWGG